MGNVDWNSLEGKYYRVDVGSTTADALGSGDNSVIYYTTDGNVVLNGQVFGGGCLDLGLVSSDDVGNAEAAKSEVAGNRQITMIRFRVQGVKSEKVTVIWQWCNGVDVCAQLKFVDKSVWRRNVIGATGVAGATTSATQWERTWAHYLGYDASTRKIQLMDYNQTAFRDVQLPLATESQAGLMSAADKGKLDGMPGEFVLDLGQVSSETFGDAQAAKSEIAGNRNIFAIRYTTQGNSALKTTVIIQWCNGTNECAQIKFTDKSQWRRNVTGANGVAGAQTRAFKWERTGAHYLGYDASTRKIQLMDYNQTLFKDVELPLATETQAGLMSAADKAKLNGNSVYVNYGGNFNVGDTIPVSQFLSMAEARAAVNKPTMYLFNRSFGIRHDETITNYPIIWRQYYHNPTSFIVTFSFAFFNGETIVKHVLTLNEAGDTWTVTA